MASTAGDPRSHTIEGGEFPLNTGGSVHLPNHTIASGAGGEHPRIFVQYAGERDPSRNEHTPWGHARGSLDPRETNFSTQQIGS